MAIDASIYGQVQQPQQINPLATLAQAYQVKGMQSQLDKADRAEQQQNKLLQLVGDPSFQGLPTAQRAAKLQGVGAFDQAGKLIETDAKVNRDAREAEKFQLEGGLKRLELIGQVAGTVKDQQTYAQALSILQSNGIDTSKFNPNYDPAGVAQFATAAMSRKDQMEQEWKAKGYDMDVRKQVEVERNNAAGNATAQGNLAVGQGNLAVNQGRLAMDQNAPKGQVVQTDGGTMIVDTRTGAARPVTDGTGQPMQKPGKAIPPNVNKSIIENQQAISTIDKAIAAIRAKPDSVGPVNMIPGAETVRQYTDPEGVEARAGVADFGSMVLHDRSGAAVTASEYPRLKPFIPTASDDSDAAIKKLERFKQIYEEEAGLLSSTYSKDQGYRESPAFKPKAPAGGGGGGNAPVKTKVIGGKTYANDGQGWYLAN